ncbi:unnamed protein product [Acanthoscelides obtectus]|uniref:C2H2-type domain-containing protein n=1 Tax=Acanthoscelides obtectus TaxID=200917 RepID=A0A9P0KQZ6_ACAOB|nr:unnamed protein product [Acanthoscelides obtectus]CAK1677100.1 hypothetical protein AOBTE_LOCUS31110 [Acanthoscelides obtectus]
MLLFFSVRGKENRESFSDSSFCSNSDDMLQQPKKKVVHKKKKRDRRYECGHCEKVSTCKKALDAHTFSFQACSKIHFDRHLLKHPETASCYKSSKCVHCGKVYYDKKNLDNHIIQKHPEHIDTVTSKIHGCAKCSLKTTKSSEFTRHMTLKHREGSNPQRIVCGHCPASFRHNRSLNDHILKKHPIFSSSVDSKKIYECDKCDYKTIVLPVKYMNVQCATIKPLEKII